MRWTSALLFCLLLAACGDVQAAWLLAGTLPAPPTGIAFVDTATVTTAISSPAGSINVPSTAGIGFYTTVTGDSHIPAGAVVTGINSTSNVVTTTPATTGTIPSNTVLTFGSTYAASALGQAGKMILRLGNPPPTASSTTYAGYPLTRWTRQASSSPIQANASVSPFALFTWVPRWYGGYAQKENNSTNGVIRYTQAGISWLTAVRYTTPQKAVAGWIVDLARGVGYRPFNDTRLCTQVCATLESAGILSGAPTQLGWVQLAQAAGFDVTGWSGLLYEPSLTAAIGSSGKTVNITGLTGSEVAGDILYDKNFREAGVIASVGASSVTLVANPSQTITTADNLTIADAAFSRAGATANPTTTATGDVLTWTYANAQAASVFTTTSTQTPGTRVSVDRLVVGQWRGWDERGVDSIMADYEANDCLTTDPCYQTRLRTILLGEVAHGQGLLATLFTDSLLRSGAYTGIGRSNAHDILTDDVDMMSVFALASPPGGDQLADLQAQTALFTGPAGSQVPPTSKLFVFVFVGPNSDPFLESYGVITKNFILAPTLAGFTGLTPLAGIFLFPSGATFGGSYNNPINRSVEALIGLPLM